MLCEGCAEIIYKNEDAALWWFVDQQAASKFLVRFKPIFYLVLTLKQGLFLVFFAIVNSCFDTCGSTATQSALAALLVTSELLGRI